MKAPILLVLAGLISTVHAAEPTGTLVLACFESGGKNRGVIVNFNAGTVEGINFGNERLPASAKIRTFRTITESQSAEGASD